jgi:hypothetical protein
MDYILFLTILFIDLVFVLIAYGVNEKNAKLLLAGYNTMSEKERKNFDLKSFLIYFKKFFINLSVYPTIFFAGLYFILRIEYAMLLYTLSIILPMPYLIYKGHQCKIK